MIEIVDKNSIFHSLLANINFTSLDDIIRGDVNLVDTGFKVANLSLAFLNALGILLDLLDILVADIGLVE